jgi:hypothetical protein
MNNEKSGLSFLEILQILFIALKLIGTINWSWLWVLSPTWISIIIVVAVIIGGSNNI